MKKNPINQLVTKRIALHFGVLFLLTVSSGMAHATLLDINTPESGHVIYDDVAGRYWMWDLNAFTNKTYTEQVAMVSDDYAAINYFGINNWHVAKLDEMQTLFNGGRTWDELMLFGPSYIIDNDEVTQIHWAGRYDSLDTNTFNHSVAGFYADYNTTSIGYGYYPAIDATQYSNVGAWVTASPVPEPSTILLLSAGLAGVAIAARRRKN
jgi:hypothetical protein